MTGALPKLGFAGIGLMGAPMTARLIDAGYGVTVWNRTRAKIEPLLGKGATEAAGPAEVTERSEIVLICLTDADAAEAVVFGAGGISEAAAADKLLVDFSSIRPDRARAMAERLRGETGMGWIDAPVSGGVRGAEDGTLAILAGGAAEEIDRVRPVLATLSQRVTHMGPSGAGQVTKLCNQVIVGSAIATIAEAVRLAEASGVDATMLAEALAGGFADSQPLQIFAPRFAGRVTEPLLGHVYTMLKDLDAARDLGAANLAPLPMAVTAAELLRRAAANGHAEEDIGMIMELLGDRGGEP
ncbi:MAG: NAD(P)-dependent oxidoreductase [Rhodospirillales bacterium]|jgi:3-hydroxyisobutyrate dehydrogenase|nr:NAD(P)-dependent oxidoreductase [Rhodospirillales bacterium]MDP6645256.1 NAD(P)-dependent oxidoreductase [Rhodospirillales bacterium]MDP6841868.1 NAD(P)-dependent oxidoreductase [Rhodospirillales bacterium]